MKKVLLSLLALIASFILLIILFLNTSLGLNIVYQQTKSLLPGHLSITNLNGHLFGTLKADSINYKNTNLKINAKKILITWQPLALFNKTLSLTQLSAASLSITQATTKSSTKQLTAKPQIQKQQRQTKKPSAISLHIGNIDIKKLSYNDGNKIKLTGKLHLQRQWQSNWQLKVKNLNVFNKQLHGSLTADGSLRGARFNPYINFNAKASAISYQERSINKLAINIHGLLAKHNSTLILDTPQFSTKLYSVGSALINQHILLKEKFFTLHTQSQTKKSSNAIDKNQNQSSPALTASIAISRDWNNLQANLTSKLEQLSFLNLILPEIKNPQGELHINFKASNLNKKPNITAHASLTKTTASIPKLGVTLSHINLQANSQGDNIFFNGDIQQDKNTLKINGQSNWRQHFTTQASINGNNIMVINTNEYQANISPDLNIHYSPNKLNIAGKILVNSAKLNPSDFQQTATVSPDIHYTNITQTKTKPLQINSDINLQLSDKVSINAYGLRGNLQGGIRLRQAANHPTYGQGQLEVKQGRYHAFGKDFKIQTGRLIFSGGLVTDPGINVRATRQLKVAAHAVQDSTSATNSNFVTGLSQLTVGIDIAGSLKRPRINLFSEPGGLSQSDILSYLIVGRPSSQAGAGGASSIIQAANALNLGASANDIEAQIQQAFGLDTLTMASQQNYNPETNTVTDNTAVMLGKYLNPKLYVSYSIGLMEPVNTLNFTYQLTHRIALQTETNGFASGADILYSFSHD